LGFPALVIVNPQGAIHSVHVGLTTAEELEELVAGVATEPPARAATGEAG
jgi:sorbitol-specific phosphotransferase system component IIBC